ncbi:hypothetical protein CRENBAI_024574 [Crenichthys baileyi]|uniref:Uncharacterized protein n=1 Tax=Crenichthys baileyi TaxID=28760 RepID=A0AAV9QPK1_9TELE
MFEFLMKTENLFSFNIHSGLHEELQGEGFTSTALNMMNIYVLTSAEQSCHRSNRTRTVLKEKQSKSSKQDLKVSELLQKMFSMLTKGDAGADEHFILLSLYFTIRKKEINIFFKIIKKSFIL